MSRLILSLPLIPMLLLAACDNGKSGGNADDGCNTDGDNGNRGNNGDNGNDDNNGRDDDFGDGCDTITSPGDEDGDGFTESQGDCNDADATISPTSEEVCDGVDNDCDREIDEDLLQAFYADGDGDGFGDSSAEMWACEAPPGHVPGGTDCDDARADVYPGAEELCDGADNDCNGLVDDGVVWEWYADGDGDGFGDPASAIQTCEPPSGYVTDNTDCDDSTGAVAPDQEERCDQRDNDCDGATDEDTLSTFYADLDGDGWGNPALPLSACANPSGYVADATDCDDALDSVNPGADERCNAIDDDCDGQIDEDAIDAVVWYEDADADGAGDAGVVALSCAAPAGYIADSSDCAPLDGAVYPGADESCDGIDNDCDGTADEPDAIDAGTWYADGDSDGYGDGRVAVTACQAPGGYIADGTDCNDGAATSNPGLTEQCDLIDNDCDGVIDEDSAVDALTWYLDADGDSFGDPGVSTTACAQPVGYESDTLDCDDGSLEHYPGAPEYCDGEDDDCDGQIDEGTAIDTQTYYTDADGDGYGDATSTVSACAQPAGTSLDFRDCDDAAAAVNPGAVEICDGLDNDCDTNIDDGATTAATWYLDADGDGYGSNSVSVSSCTQPAGYVGTSGDCSDVNAAVNPGAAEACNGTDDNCDGVSDNGGTRWHMDADGDGYGNAAYSVMDCSQPAGYAAAATDCDDGNAAVSPGDAEACNGIDDDCDGQADEAGATGGTAWYRDADGDGYGTSGTSTVSCTQPAGYVSATAGADCNDGNAAISPGDTELCNGTDDDCDGSTDESSAADASTWYRDADGDGYGSATNGTQVSCTQPVGYTASATDCNDGVSATNPGAAETCNSRDDDCDGSVDEGSIGTTWYRDADSDGYGGASSVQSCTQPAGYTASSTDCEDAISSINPGAVDACDTVDNDCDGYADNDGLCPCVVLYYNNTPYMFCTSTTDWYTAQASCNNYGYDLVTVNNSAENTWLVDQGYRYYRGKWWTGGNDAASEGRWTWENGQSWTYSAWHAGEPNNSNLGPGGEDCMQLGRFLDYTWNDEPCGWSFRYICEAN